MQAVIQTAVEDSGTQSPDSGGTQSPDGGYQSDDSGYQTPDGISIHYPDVSILYSSGYNGMQVTGTTSLKAMISRA